MPVAGQSIAPRRRFKQRRGGIVKPCLNFLGQDICNIAHVAIVDHVGADRIANPGCQPVTHVRKVLCQQLLILENLNRRYEIFDRPPVSGHIDTGDKSLETWMREDFEVTHQAVVSGLADSLETRSFTASSSP